MSSDFLKITFCNGENGIQKCFDPYQNRVFPFARSEVYFAPIENAETLTKRGDTKRVYRLVLNLKGINQEFLPGDSIGVIPRNDKSLVDKLLLRLNAESLADKTCRIEISELTTKKKPVIPKHIPANSTLRTIFLNCLDIQTPPKKLFLKSLLRFTNDPEETAKLEHVCSAKGSKEYGELITGTCRTLLGLLNTFPSCRPTVEIILEHLPPLQPRPYSISSSPLVGEKLEITFFVLEKDDGSKGLCTGWLESLIQRHKSQDPVVPFYFRQSNRFRLQDDFSGAIILIATGTGLAPFRGFLQHKYLQAKGAAAEDNIWLFYGCRYSDRDFLYKEEINQFLKRGVLTKFNLAASRENTTEKFYVQNKIREHGQEVVKWIFEGAKVFVCGDAQTMVRDVKSCLGDIFKEFGRMNFAEAHEYLEEMDKNNVFIVDNWT